MKLEKSTKDIIKVSKAVVANPSWQMKCPIDFSIKEGENIAVVGTNGSGKTLLINTLISSYPLLSGTITYNFEGADTLYIYNNVQYLAFNDTYSVADYYQQRWNASELDDSPIVKDCIGINKHEYLDLIVESLNISTIINKRLILLSNGELRKFLIIKALLSKPKVLILDNPFIGLDVESRKSLEILLNDLSINLHLSVVLVFSQLTYIPDFVTSVVVVDNMQCQSKVSKEEYLHNILSISLDRSHILLKEKILNLRSENSISFSEVVELNNISLKYGDIVIFDKLNWLIK